ncbi:hypothetical protein D9758_002090 [Tetrapyrgos nigripes]|uniref:ATP-NAD kinase n=1 Tax=Tetrapyrgos nigripes TaxID=182062 RepID=A0A8H5LV54_9AGAR|nr:hypothetical protein D9758_002090 [Tetrapyrgos nigripes]
MLPTPDNETFSTPPTTPGVLDTSIRPSLSRRGSRPSSLHLDAQSGWNPDILVEDTSPELMKKLSDSLSPYSQDHIITPTSSTNSSAIPSGAVNGRPRRPLDSPCFVHSHLDKGASLSEWLRNKRESMNSAVSLQPHSDHSSPNTTSGSDSISIDDDDYGASLTKQLAETAVGVRELSKQLGRARIRANIQNILIITKARDNRLIKLTRQLALYLMLKPRPGQKRGLVVYVDNQLRTSRRFDAEGIERDHPGLFVPFPRRRTSSSNSLSSMSSASTTKDEFYLKEEGQLRYWTSSMCSQSPHLFDFVITLGGDGTVLFTSWLFQRIVPPVLPFALGSLGFLTNFDFADHQAVMDSAIDSGIRVNLRMRFTCTVYRAVANEVKGRKAVKKGETGEILMRNIEQDGWEALEGGWSGGPTSEPGKACKDKEIMCFTTRPVETFEILNDLVVDRGPSPYVSLLELFGDEHHMTTVQADGLTVSTPTGSTAYSLSAGGSLVHPEIPALLITPICPHTLSFRPMLLPDSMELRICVPYNSRSTAWASFDGRGRVELKQGDHIKVTASKYPFPTVCADKQSTDWFHSISRTLKWNERERQKSFVVVEEGPEGAMKRKKKLAKAGVGSTQEETPEDEEEDEVTDEEEDKFDIDDSSPEAAAINALNDRDQQLGQEKTKEVVAEEQLHQMLAKTAARRSSKSRSRSRHRSTSRNRSGLHSGIDSPNRFAGPEPHLPSGGSPRHVEFDVSADSSDSGYVETGRNGTRDDLRTARKPSSKSRIPKDRDPSELENVKTPTVGHPSHPGRMHSRSRSGEYVPHRAFAVWGQDESDSNASDSDV